MPTKPQKRKSSTEHSSDAEQRRAKKRLQNRISQQFFREKQATYIQHLEQFVNSVEKSAGFASSDAAERLRLIRENHALRDSLLEMRKKLLSLGAQATSLANMLKIEKEVDGDEEATVRNPEDRLEKGHADDDGSSIHAEESSPSLNAPAAPLRVPEKPRGPAQSLLLDETLSSMLLGDPVPTTLHENDECTQPQPTASSDTLSSLMKTQQNAAKRTGGTPGWKNNDTDFATFFARDRVRFSPLHGILVTKPLNAQVNCPLVALETQLHNTLKQYSIRSLHKTLSIRPFPSDLDDAEISEFESKIFAEIVHVAIEAVLKCSRVGGYSHIMCPQSVVEKVLVWRRFPTPEHRNKVDHPFRPTVLQQRFPNHHPAIDLLYWDELRDQLILCQEEVEIGILVYRCHLSSVIEFPDQGASLSHPRSVHLPDESG